MSANLLLYPSAIRSRNDAMRPVPYYVNITLDGRCDHRWRRKNCIATSSCARILGRPVQQLKREWVVGGVTLPPALDQPERDAAADTTFAKSRMAAPASTQIVTFIIVEWWAMDARV